MKIIPSWAICQDHPKKLIRSRPLAWGDGLSERVISTSRPEKMGKNLGKRLGTEIFRAKLRRSIEKSEDRTNQSLEVFINNAVGRDGLFFV